MESKKNDTNDLIYKIEIDSQTEKTFLLVTKLRRLSLKQVFLRL